MKVNPLRWLAVTSFLLGSSSQAFSQGALTRGLWVGEITLDGVNEVSVPLNASNVPIAPSLDVTTPTADLANLRVILHVNGAGQVSLIREVAVLDRIPPGARKPSEYGSELELALVTDERLYPEFPAQPARRIASAAFDFGDGGAKDAVDAVIGLAAASAATAAVALNSTTITTSAQRATAVATVKAAVLAKLADPDSSPATPQNIIAFADLTARFDSFMRNTLKKADVTALATGGSEPLLIQAEAAQLAAGISFVDASGVTRTVLADPRAREMIAAVKAAGTAQAAQNAASAFADVDDLYGRFLAGSAFNIVGAGETRSINLSNVIRAAALAGSAANAAGESVAEAIRGSSAAAEVQAARAEAIRIQVKIYDDNRASAAIEAILNAMVAKAATLTGLTAGQFTRRLEDAANEALAASTKRSLVSAFNPTQSYIDFVRSGAAFTANEKFSSSIERAATAAAESAVAERLVPLSNNSSILRAATLGTSNALASIFTASARTGRSSQPLIGALVPGGTVSGTLVLPANHPTNPFRHRRHPDHTRGFDIERRLSFAVDATAGSALKPVSFGVDELSGRFEEEIFGLHKPLGPERNIGLKVSGRFVLKRVSLIDTLNAR